MWVEFAIIIDLIFKFCCRFIMNLEFLDTKFAYLALEDSEPVDSID